MQVRFQVWRGWPRIRPFSLCIKLMPGTTTIKHNLTSNDPSRLGTDNSRSDSYDEPPRSAGRAHTCPLERRMQLGGSEVIEVQKKRPCPVTRELAVIVFADPAK